MAKVMIRRTENGDLSFYIAKKDLEEKVVSLEHPGPEKWGGKVELADGSQYTLEIYDVMPRLPITLIAKRL